MSILIFQGALMQVKRQCFCNRSFIVNASPPRAALSLLRSAGMGPVSAGARFNRSGAMAPFAVDFLPPGCDLRQGHAGMGPGLLRNLATSPPLAAR